MIDGLPYGRCGTRSTAAKTARPRSQVLDDVARLKADSRVADDDRFGAERSQVARLFNLRMMPAAFVSARGGQCSSPQRDLSVCQR